MPESELLKSSLVEVIWSVVDRLPQVVSATIAGSFSSGIGLEGVADIDTILIVENLTMTVFVELQDKFAAKLKSVLHGHGYGLRINPTLGPLKLNDERTAVLHLMVYSPERHREHAIHSPFTCFDWQRSLLWRKASLTSVYPVFGLQPRHFIGARRGAADYLRDLTADAVTYRELEFTAEGYQEQPRSQPMTTRDRHEFVYHVMRFVMQNFLKLVRRQNESEEGTDLLSAYFQLFPQGADQFHPFYQELSRRKQSADFRESVPRLTETAVDFVQAFEEQFRETFERQATRHLVFRHAPTQWNLPIGAERVFQGRSDAEICPVPSQALTRLGEAVKQLGPVRTFSSPLQRAQQSLEVLFQEFGDLQSTETDSRLLEIDYGDWDGKTVAQCQREYPNTFAAWNRGEDPSFTGGGENTAAVLMRGREFANEHWQANGVPSLTCTHNVMLRTIIGERFAISPEHWHRLNIPCLAPITLIATKKFGLFAEVSEDLEREMFADFFQGSRS